MKIGVKVLPRKEVLDSQGRAVQKTLDHQGMAVKQCRVGRYVELEIDADSEEKAFLINTLEKDKISYDDCLRAKVFILKYTANNPPFT